MHATLLLALLAPEPSPEPPDPKKETREQLIHRLGRLPKDALAKKLPPEKLVDYLFAQTLGRAPRPEEAKSVLRYLAREKKPHAVQDVTWALINSREFLARHKIEMSGAAAFGVKIAKEWEKAK